ncbi:MAG: hypothetical protein JNM17_29340 [Archangium sp.]|nr:hypothetical protein [Archangium sp.]
MKKSLGLLLGMLVAGCTNQVHPLSISQIVPLGPAADLELKGCQFTDSRELVTTNAKLDVATGDPQVNLGIRLTGTGYRNQGLVLKTGEVLEPASQNAPVLTSVVMNYRLSRRLGATPRTFTQALIVPFTESGDEILAQLAVPLISQELGQQLFDGLTPSAALDDFVDVNVDMEFRGEMDSSRAFYSSGVVTFPIRAVRSLPAATCGAGLRFKRYPHTDKDGDPDLCNYAGTTYGLVGGFASPPTVADCCDPAANVPGC